MNRSLIALSGASLVFAPAAAMAQDAAAAPVAQAVPAVASTPFVVGAPASNIIRAGTPVALKMAEGLTTEGKKLRVGQRFQLEVAEPVELNGQVVIPVGSPATGEVTEIRNKGMWGKSGHITARVLYVRANGRQIRMTGGVDDKGVTGTAGVVGAVALVPIAGFFVTGTSARIPMDAPVKGFIDEDVVVAFAPEAAPAPMTVPAATPPAQLASSPVATPAPEAAVATAAQPR